MAASKRLGSTILRKLVHLGIRGSRAAKNTIKASRLYSGLIYDLTNMNTFSDLFMHELMLADSVRVDTYAEGIRRHIGPGDVVVDLGTGTGILAMLAARQGASVYAIDHSEIIDIAKKIAEHNNITNVSFLQVNSKDFNPPEKLDVILHEQIGDDLFEENMVGNLLDMKQRLLKDTGKILPGRFELFLEPIALTEDGRIPFIHELRVQDIDFGFMQELSELEKYRADQYPYRFIDRASFDFILSEPEPILSFDLNDLADPNSLPTSFSVSRTVRQAGTMDGICLFFRTLFDDDIQFSTAPDQPRTHWLNRMFRTDQREYAAGDEIRYDITMGQIWNVNTWTVSVR